LPLASTVYIRAFPSKPLMFSFFSRPLLTMLWQTALHRTPGGRRFDVSHPSQPSTPTSETQPET
jgi:hypothetical protein